MIRAVLAELVVVTVGLMATDAQPQFFGPAAGPNI